MRILVLNWKDRTHPAAGGAEVYVDAITRRWAEWGHDVTLLCGLTAGQEPTETVGGVRIVRRGGRFSVYQEARRWYRREGRGRFDVVLDVVNTRPFLTPAYVDDARVVALIFQVAREVWSYEMPCLVALAGRHWLEPRWLRQYSRIPTVTISESSRRSLKAYGLRDITVVPVGLEVGTLPARPPREERPTVAFLGRLAANKRPDDALHAFRLARRGVPALQMWVLGTGPLEASLREEFRDDPVQFFGRVSDESKLELLARAHAVLVTSVREGWGLVVTEAATVGTPAIGYDVAGLRDSLRASDGVVVRPNVAELASTIESLLPLWASRLPTVAPGGVESWTNVAGEVLRHLERDGSHADH